VSAAEATGRSDPRFRRVEDRISFLPSPRRNQFAAQFDHLAEYVAGGTDPLTPGEEGLADLRVMEAIYRSARERRHVSLSA